MQTQSDMDYLLWLYNHNRKLSFEYYFDYLLKMDRYLMSYQNKNLAKNHENHFPGHRYIYHGICIKLHTLEFELKNC